jgi:hypothetical protein
VSAWRTGWVVLRNGLAVAGVALLGWPVTHLVVFYFADTLAGFWSVSTAVMARLIGADVQAGPLDTLYGFLSAMMGGLFLAAVLAVPLGVPLIFVLGLPLSIWREVAADPWTAGAAGMLALGAVVEMGRQFLAMREGAAGEARVKQVFAILLTRWVLVVIVATWLTSLPGVGPGGRFVPFVLVVVYAAASAWSDLAPERFARLINDGRRRGRGA